MKKYYFISGLPRSGSTLLCNILAQNSRFHSTCTSGCLDVLFGVRNTWDMLIEHKAHPDNNCKQNVLRAIFQAYYDNVTKPVVFDKSRGWLSQIEFAEHLLQQKIKVLVPVRSIPDILASMEKLHRATSKVKQPPGEAENYFLFQTIEGRCEYWCRIDNLVGLAYNRILDALNRGFQDRLYFVEFDELTREPRKVLKEIYGFLGESYYEHDFDHVEQVTWEDDALHGYLGLHNIRPRVQPCPSMAMEILGKKLVDKYQTSTINMPRE